MLKAKDLKIIDDVSPTYNQFKTYRAGLAKLRTLAGIQGISPPRSMTIDFQSDTGLIPLEVCFSQDGKYGFGFLATTGGVGQIVCYDMGLDTDTPVPTYLGRVNMNIPTAATTHTLKGCAAVVSGGISRLFFLTTGSVLANGGLFMVTSLPITDFVKVGFPTIAMASPGDTQASKKVFFLQETNVNGGSASHALTAGVGVALDEVNPYIYVINGTLTTTWQVYRFKYDDPITTVGPSFGITTDLFSANGWKTGNLPAGVGTFLLLNCVDYFVPTSGHLGSNAGSPCISFFSGSNMYHGKISDLGASVTTWPSLVTANPLSATGDQITGIAPTIAVTSSVLDAAILFYSGKIFLKKFQNNAHLLATGCTDSTLQEFAPLKEPALGLINATGLAHKNGWVFVLGSTSGQRVMVGSHLRSDQVFDYSYFITPVINTPKQKYKALQVVDNIASTIGRGDVKVEYRTSGFGSATGGWLPCPDSRDYESLIEADQVQFKFRFYYSKNASAIPSHISKAYLVVEEVFGSSDYWTGSQHNTSETSPVRAAFRLMTAYESGTVPTLKVDWVKDDGSIYLTQTTVANAADFRYSTDQGATWNPLGTIPNVAGTEVDVLLSSPPGYELTARIYE